MKHRPPDKPQDASQLIARKVEALATTLAEDRALRADEHQTNLSIQRSIKLSQWVIAGAAIFSAIVGVQYAVTTHSQLEAMKAANSTTNRSVAVAIEGQKPWILVAGIETIEPPAQNKAATMKLHLQNFGATPALAVTVLANASVAEDEITEAFVEKYRDKLNAPTTSVAVIGPRSAPAPTMDMYSPTFSPALWTDYEAGRRKLVVFGEIRYGDTFDQDPRARLTRFCQYFDPAHSAWLMCEQFNSAK